SSARNWPRASPSGAPTIPSRMPPFITNSAAAEHPSTPARSWSRNKNRTRRANMRINKLLLNGTAVALVLGFTTFAFAQKDERTAGSDTYKALHLFGDVFEQVRA